MLSKKKLNDKVQRLRELERQISDLVTESENLKDDIKAEMTTQGVNELIGDDWKVTWTPYSSNRFDQKSFKEAHPALYESFTKVTESRRFSFK